MLLQVTDQMGMLKYMYTEFKKPVIAGFCVELAKCMLRKNAVLWLIVLYLSSVIKLIYVDFKIVSLLQ